MVSETYEAENEKDLVPRPSPPFQISKPASAPIRYHPAFVEPRRTLSFTNAAMFSVRTDAVPRARLYAT